MTSPNERLIRILSGMKADRPACICPGGMMNMVTKELQDVAGVYLPEAHTDATLMAELAEAIVEQGCFENYGVPFCMTVEAEALGAACTMGTQLYEPHVTGYAIDTVLDRNKLTPMDLESGRAKVTLDAIRLLRAYRDRRREEEGAEQDIPIIGNLTGPVSVASSVMEPTRYYKQLRQKREEAHAYMEFITQELIRFGLAEVEAGADVIVISDPSGTGEILGPKFFDEYAVTYLNKLVDAVEAAGAKTIVHICGHMKAVYDNISRIRSDAFSFDAVVSLREAREHLPDKVLMGNVSTFAIELQDEKTVERLTRNCLNTGSDIISPACGLGMGSPLRNVQAVLQTVRQAGE
ncbi:MAG: methylcobamide--CoM methyltransferase [Mogibacterium sp.]|nr:methylcobamide--CoM methyltransferase [Mogibacterium sp.]